MRNLLLCLLACSLLALFAVSCETDEDDSGGNGDTATCEIVPDTLMFGGILLGEHLDITTTLSITSWPPEIDENDCDAYKFIDPLTGDPVDILDFGALTVGEHYEYVDDHYEMDVVIRFAPLVLGAETCELYIDYNVGGTYIECPTLVLRGGGIEECGFSESSLDFPTTVTVGSYADLPVTLYVYAWPPDNPTLGCDDFLFVNPIYQTEVSTLDFANPSYPYEYNQVTGVYSTELTIRFAPLSEGAKNCTLNIVRTGENAYDCPTLSLSGTASTTGNWTLFTPVTAYDLKDVYGDADEVYACGDAGTIVRHTHGDPAFTVWMEEDLDETPLDAIWVDTVSAFNPVWVGGGIIDGGITYGRLYRNSDGSTTWDEVILYPEFAWHLDKVTAIWGSGTCDKYYGGIAYSGMMSTMYQWDCTELVNWLLGDGYTEITGIHGCGLENNAWATLANPWPSGERVYHYDGSGWTMNQETWMDQACYDVWAAPGCTMVWVVGANGAIYRWNGSSWSDQSISGEMRTIYGIWGFTAADIYAVGAEGLFYHYDGTWTEMEVGGTGSGGTSETLYAVWGLEGPDRIYAVGTNGTTIRYMPNP